MSTVLLETLTDALRFIDLKVVNSTEFTFNVMVNKKGFLPFTNITNKKFYYNFKN